MIRILMVLFGSAVLCSASTEEIARAILVKSCYSCHSTKTKAKSGLVVDSRAGLLKGGSRGPAIVPGDPERSILIKSLRPQPGVGMVMPATNNPLPEWQIEELYQWIRMGAPWTS